MNVKLIKIVIKNKKSSLVKPKMFNKIFSRTVEKYKIIFYRFIKNNLKII